VQELEELVAKTVNLPSVPQALVRLQETIAKPDASVGDAVKILEDDPGLAAKCLQVANSAAYGLRVRSSSLRHASAVLGLRALRDIALQTSLVASYSHLKKYSGFQLGRFWKHATVTGVIAKQVARCSRFLRGVDVDAMTSAGLLHNMGRLAMLDAFRDEYLRVIHPVGSRGSLAVRAEREAFGFDHALAGSVLASRWKMGDEIICTARDHHLSGDDVAPIAQVIGFANETAHVVIDHGEKALRDSLASPAAVRFQIREDAMDILVETIVLSADQAATYA